MAKTCIPIEKLASYYQLFPLEAISQVPRSTGLYAWYASLSAGSKDWQLEIVDGRDVGIERLRSLLKRQTDRYSFRTLDATAKGLFSQTWLGRLHDQTSDTLKNALTESSPGLERGDYDSRRAPKLQSTLESENSRHLMVEALEIAIPFLSSPVYIGVADCLNTRINQHVREINELASAVTRDPDIRDRLQRETKANFAVRVIASGFLPANLRVLTLNLDALAKDLDIDVREIRSVAEAIEWLLNRWNHPYLGRR